MVRNKDISIGRIFQWLTVMLGAFFKIEQRNGTVKYDNMGVIETLAAAALTLTPKKHGGSTILLSHTGAASTVTLPPATGSGTRFKFIVAAVNTSSHIIEVANSTDVFEGAAIMLADAGSTVVGFESGASDDTLTLNGTTTGGAAIGDSVEVVDYASGKWHIEARLTGTGTEATPFSAAV